MDKKTWPCPGPVAQLVRVSTQYAKVVGSIPGQDTYKNQPMNASIHETTNSLSPSPSLSLKSVLKIKNKLKNEKEGLAYKVTSGPWHLCILILLLTLCSNNQEFLSVPYHTNMDLDKMLLSLPNFESPFLTAHPPWHTTGQLEAQVHILKAPCTFPSWCLL